jgi:hypothetical protein
MVKGDWGGAPMELRLFRTETQPPAIGIDSSQAARVHGGIRSVPNGESAAASDALLITGIRLQGGPVAACFIH